MDKKREGDFIFYSFNYSICENEERETRKKKKNENNDCTFLVNCSFIMGIEITNNTMRLFMPFPFIIIQNTCLFVLFIKILTPSSSSSSSNKIHQKNHPKSRSFCFLGEQLYDCDGYFTSCRDDFMCFFLLF